MAIQILDDRNFASLAHPAAGILIAINPYCELHQDYLDRKINAMVQEGKKQAKASTIALGEVVARIDPDLTIGHVDDTARNVLRSLRQLQID